MAEHDEVTFPESARGELDRALEDLVERANDVMKTQSQLRALLQANQGLVAHLDLPTVLRTIVDAAVELVNAQYGALGVVAHSGGLEQFIHVGMTPHQVRTIGHLPEGHGLLGALIDDPHAIRLHRIGDDARSVGFPEGHPPMESFLGVPIRVRETVYGNLYMTNHRDGGFSEGDEQLLTALAATAGIVIDNARLFAEVEARNAWNVAAGEVTQAFLSGEPLDALRDLVSHVESLSASRLVCIFASEADSDVAEVVAASGHGASVLQGTLQPMDSQLRGCTADDSVAVMVERVSGEWFRASGLTAGPALIAPLLINERQRMLLVATREADSPSFTSFDLERVASIASRSAIGLRLATARLEHQRMVRLEDRSRIARNLHDHVIQQLFAAGLELQILQTSVDSDNAGRIEAIVTLLDDAIAQIRTIVLALSERRGTRVGVRQRIIDVADQLGDALAQPASLAFSGPVDLVVDAELADDVVAFVRESLSNVVRHAHATSTSIVISASFDTLTVVVEDNGIGIGRATRRSGLQNGAERAEQYGGTLVIESGAEGTRLSWSVPIGTEA